MSWSNLLKECLVYPAKVVGTIPMERKLRKEYQELRAQQAERRADETLVASSRQMRKAERGSREAVYKAEVFKWRIEGGGLRPRGSRSLIWRR
jgi:hypothetical protein